MTPLGKHPLRRSLEGAIIIHPEAFIRINWTTLCDICGFAYEPQLRVVRNPEAECLPNFFGLSTLLEGRHHVVWLNPSELQNDSIQFCNAGGRLIAGLWAISLTMLRIILTSEGVIPLDQYIGARVARRGGFFKETTQKIHTQIHHGHPSYPEYRAKFDAWVIYNAIYRYIQLYNLDQEVDAEDIQKILRAEKDLVVPNFFP